MIVTLGMLTSFKGFAAGEIPSLGQMCSLKFDMRSMRFEEFEFAYAHKPSSIPKSDFSRVCAFKDRLLSLETFEERNALIESSKGLPLRSVLEFGWMILINNAPDEFANNSPYTKAALEVAGRCFENKDRNLEIYKFLIEKNPDLEIKFFSLVNAVQLDRTDVLQLLMDHEIGRRERNSFPFSIFPAVNDCLTLNSREDPPLGPDIINSVNRFGQTLLHKNIRFGEVRTTQFLIENGADINALDKDGRSPLFYAVLDFGKDLSSSIIEEKFNFLLSQGADINQKNQYGRTLLHEAVYYSDYNRYYNQMFYDNNYCDCSWNQFSIRIHIMLRLLVENGADMRLQDDEGRTVMEYAATENYYKDALESLQNIAGIQK